jgi:hypothetical protein
VSSILLKLGVPSRAAAVAVYLQSRQHGSP